MACEDFEFSKFPCAWVLCCGVWGLWVFKALLGVDSVLWCVKTLRFKVYMYVGPVLWYFQALSQYWRDWFSKKSPYRDFPSVLERLFFGVKISIGIFPCAALCSNFLWPPVKGTVSPYVVENASPWWGYTVKRWRLSKILLALTFQPKRHSKFETS